MRNGRLRQLAFVPALALYPFVPTLIPQAYAQACTTSEGSPTPCVITPQPTASASDVQAVAAASQGVVRDQVRGGIVIIDQHLREIGRDLARGKPAGGAGTGRYGSSGLAAGSEPVSFAAWADASGSYLANDSAGNAYQGRSVTALSGIDAVIGTSWVAGLSAGYSSAALSVAALNGTRTSTGAVVGPYASYVIDENFTVDASLSYWRLTNRVAAPSTTSSSPSLRYVGAVNLNAFADAGPVSLTGFAGYSYAYEHAAGFTDNGGTLFPSVVTRYGALRLGGEASYKLGDFEPYVPITYEYETTTPQDGTTRNDVVVGLGLRYQIGDQLKLGLVVNAELFRQHQQDESIAANLRYAF